MRGQVLLIVMLTAATAARPQVAPSATGGAETPDTQMMTPPPVSGTSYPTEVGSEVQTNYLRGGLTSTTAYIDNLYSGTSSTPIAETTESVLPSISYDMTTARRHTTFYYSPGFTFYRPTSALNEVSNTAAVNCGFRLTQHSVLSATDNFQDSSFPFNPLGAGASAPVSGSPLYSTPGIIPPFAKLLTNFANVELTLQTGRNVMIGGSGLETELHYPRPAQAVDLYDSSSRGGTAFYDRRISPSQYFGADYQYMDMLATPLTGTFTTQTHTISGYYTFRPKATLSMSVSSGPQYYKIVETPLPAMGSWAPSVLASISWQGVHTNIAASYSQEVTGGGGLLGAFHSKSANANGRWQMARTWTTSMSGAYSITKSVSQLLIAGEPGGHSVSGSATLEHSLGNQLSVAIHYERMHESYGEVAALAVNPNSDRETISVVWHFERPLGR